MNPVQRIAYLDGLRCVAIGLVLLHHYCTRWTYPIEAHNLYPYADAFASFTLAKYGYFGVHLFFVISGFVIALTLGRCSTAMEFFVRRFARLWPTMALCSALTWIVVPILPDAQFHVSGLNFLPSMTFIAPDVFNYLFHTARFDWMDGAYWSLWVEVRFYVLMALLYFIAPARFASTLLGFAVVVLAAYTVTLRFGMGQGALLLKGFFIAQHLPWFLFGVAFYLRREGKPAAGLIAIAILALLAQAFILRSLPTLIALACIPALVWAGSIPSVGRILSVRWLTWIGATSYSLYLLHQQIGVSLIHSLGVLIPLRGPVTILYAVAVAALMIFIAGQIYRYLETPMSKSIVGMLPAK